MNESPINAKPALIFTAVTIFAIGLSWALRALSKAVDFSSLMVLGILGIAAMISCGFAWDWYEARRKSPNQPPAPRQPEQ